MPDVTPDVSEEAQAELDAQKKAEEEAAEAKLLEGAKDKSEVKSFDQEYVDSLRSESAKYRKRAQEAETQIKTHDQDKMSEIEKAQSIATDAEAKVEGLTNLLAAERTRNAVTLEATRMDFRDPFDALSLLDVSDLNYDEETGKPTIKSVQGALKTLVKDKPYLLKEESGSGSADGGARGGTGEVTQEQKIAGYEKELQEQYGTVPMPPV
jgi:hypothetical protein